MRYLSFLFLACALFAQDPNANYRTKEGRDRMADTLDSPTRAEGMHLSEVVQMLKVKPGDSVADVGTGTGILVPLLSAAVGAKGRVYAEDIFPDFLDRVRTKVAREHMTNVTIVLGSENDPWLPQSQLAAAAVIDAYHHFEHPKEMLAGIHSALAAGGRLAIVDFLKSASPSPGHIQKDRDEVVREIEQNGFKLEQNTKISERQYALVFRKS